MSDKWKEYERKYRKELVDLIRLYSRTSDYYRHKARCAKTPEETFEILDIFNAKKKEISDKIRLALPTPEDMPRELLEEVARANKILTLGIRGTRYWRMLVRENITQKDFDEFEKRKKYEKGTMSDRWKEYERKYKKELVDLIRLYVDTSDYYYYKARCAERFEETLKILNLRSTKKSWISKKILLAAPTSEDMPRELLEELATVGKIPPCGRYGARLWRIDHSEKGYRRRAELVRENITQKDFDEFEKLKKYIFEKYGGEP